MRNLLYVISFALVLSACKKPASGSASSYVPPSSETPAEAPRPSPESSPEVSVTNRTWVLPSGLSDHFNPGGHNIFASSVSAVTRKNHEADIVFTQPPADGGVSQVFKAHYRNSSWSLPANANDHIDVRTKRGGTASISGNENGNLLITWSGWDNTSLCGLGTPCHQTFFAQYRNDTWTNVPVVDANNNISPDGYDISSPQSAMDDDGSAIVGWVQSNGVNRQVYVSRFQNGVWTHPTANEFISPLGADVSTMNLAMDGSGNAIVVWAQSARIFKSEFRNGAWTHPANLNDFINPAGTDAVDPQVAMKSGKAIIVWKQSDGSSYQVFKSEYRNNAWTHPSGLQDNISPNGSWIFQPQVAMSENGEAVVAWRQYDAGFKLQVLFSEYRNGNWVHPAQVIDHVSVSGYSAGDTISSQPQLDLAMDDSGNTLMVWRQSNGTHQQVFKSQYEDGIWTHPSGISDNISPDGKDAFMVQASISTPGMGLILWTQRDNANDVQAYKAEYR